MLAREPMSQPFASNADLPFAVHCGNSERGTKKAVFPLSELNSGCNRGARLWCWLSLVSRSVAYARFFAAECS